MRFESPLNSAEFRREALLVPESENSATNPEGQRISIRPLAGRAVGTYLQPGVARRVSNMQFEGLLPVADLFVHLHGSLTGHHNYQVQEENRSSTPLSRKQGPSHRKVRRWNNDNFTRLASELANIKGTKAAEALFYGQADAHQYRSIFNPAEHKSQSLSQYVCDKHSTLSIELRHFRE
jgi:hypothetical protein